MRCHVSTFEMQVNDEDIIVIDKLILISKRRRNVTTNTWDSALEDKAARVRDYGDASYYWFYDFRGVYG